MNMDNIMNGVYSTHDFGDGKGPVLAHKHPNGGGWVANTADVDDTAFVGPNACVSGSAGRAWRAPSGMGFGVLPEP